MTRFAVGALLYIAVSFGLEVLTGRLIHASIGDDHERGENDGDKSK